MIPTVSHAPPLPRIRATAAPMPIPSAIPNPICIDGRFIVNSVVPSLRDSVVLLNLSQDLRPGPFMCRPFGAGASCSISTQHPNGASKVDPHISNDLSNAFNDARQQFEKG